MDISVVVGQFPILFDVKHNLKTIVSIIDRAHPDELVVLPEGALSGYSEDPVFLNQIDTNLLEDAYHQVRATAVRKGVHIIFGSCLLEEGNWWNAGIYFSPQHTHFVYRKVNLATHERGYFAAGSDLSVFPIVFKNGCINVGIQLCREIRFPEQWRHLALQGADIFVYLTNAANPREQLAVWKSHLISRAAENQRFVISANVAHPFQHCPTMILSPKGEVLKEVVSERTEVLRCRLHLPEISNWYLDQARTDIVGIYYKGHSERFE